MFKQLRDRLKAALGRVTSQVAESAVRREVVEERFFAKTDNAVEQEVVEATGHGGGPKTRQGLSMGSVLAEAQADEGVLARPAPPERGESTRGPTILERVKERLTTINLSPQKFDEVFWDLEVVLMENNVAVAVIEKIKGDLRQQLCSNRVSRAGVEEIVTEALRRSVLEILSAPPVDLVGLAKSKSPYVICVIGVNGSGKTTTLAKLAYLFKSNGLSVVMAAADTFRAAAIQQLEEHARRLDVRLIKQGYQADPAAVAYDAVAHAKANGLNVVLIDTAGRLHSNDNLMAELKKVVRVNSPDFKLFVGESITGNDCVEQAQVFDEAVGIDGIILAKADVDEKGGAALSIAYVVRKPILYLGTGQHYADLEPFRPGLILESLGLE